MMRRDHRKLTSGLPPMNWLRRAGLVVAALGSVLVVLTGSLPVGQAAGSAPPRYRIQWAPCPGSATTQCGTLQVPVDWSQPGGAKISIAVARHHASDPGRRIGTLFFNPGGPGDGAARYVVAADTFFSETLRSRFDIVGMDPRGIGASTPIRCGVPVFTPELTFFPRTRQEFDRFRAHNRAVGQSCLQATGDQVRHSDTASVARDHEALRIALHAPQVSWLMLSYGTQVAANYAQLYPNRVRAMVLDAALEHSAPEVLLTAEAITTVETAFNRFARWCDTAPDCALRGQDVGAVYDRLVIRANRHPIPVQGALRPVTGDDIRMRTPVWLTLKDANVFGGPDLSWATFSKVIQLAVAGDASGFAFEPPQGPTDGIFGIAANGCGDYAVDIHSYGDMQRRIQMGKQLAPHLQGASENWQLVLCVGWPIAPANPPRRLDVTGVPTLIVHATHDPSTSYKNAFGLAAQIRGSAVLTRTGDGHTNYYTSDCARTAIDRYLVHPQAPPAGVCTT